jgi:hypothetical protein
MPRAKKAGAAVVASEDGTLAEVVPLVVITPTQDKEDRALIAQFAVGLLRDGTGSYDADDVALRNRTKDALNRARVMLEEFKKFEV